MERPGHDFSCPCPSKLESHLGSGSRGLKAYQKDLKHLLFPVERSLIKNDGYTSSEMLTAVARGIAFAQQVKRIATKCRNSVRVLEWKIKEIDDITKRWGSIERKGEVAAINDSVGRVDLRLKIIQKALHHGRQVGSRAASDSMIHLPPAFGDSAVELDRQDESRDTDRRILTRKYRHRAQQAGNIPRQNQRHSGTDSCQLATGKIKAEKSEQLQMHHDLLSADGYSPQSRPLLH